jgi:hypothetical protein
MITLVFSLVIAAVALPRPDLPVTPLRRLPCVRVRTRGQSFLRLPA